jgi:hypothetical protein
MLDQAKEAVSIARRLASSIDKLEEILRQNPTRRNLTSMQISSSRPTLLRS